MGYGLVFDEKKNTSKEVAGLMSCILHTVIGAKNNEINGWELTQPDVAALVFKAISLKQPEELRAFQAQFIEHYWSRIMMSDPRLCKAIVDYVCDEFSVTLAKMIYNKKDVILAYWE